MNGKARKKVRWGKWQELRNCVGRRGACLVRRPPTEITQVVGPGGGPVHMSSSAAGSGQ